MIAVDTNVLVYAHREDSDFHSVAFRRLVELAEGKATWAVPWPCMHEFFSIVTHPRIFDPPTPQAAALEQIEAWLQSPSLTLLSETATHWTELRTLLVSGKISGPMVHDARVAALCIQHGVRQLWSSDRDFGRFPALNVVNPLADGV
jgi:toxin-antitoxin system PIN domain toxin